VTAVTRIDQVIPTLASRDAIGGHVMQLRDLLRTRGYASDIYYGNASPDRLDEGFPITRIGEPRPPVVSSSTSCPSAAVWPTSSATGPSASS